MRTESLAIVYNKDHIFHRTRKEDPCEVAERVETIKSAVEESDIRVTWIETTESEHPLIWTIHSREMVRRLKAASSFAMEGEEVFTKFYAEGDNYHSTPITKGTYNQALISVSCALEAANRLLEGSTIAFSLSRPPGHHAGRNFYHGFCFLNNAAIAAKKLSERNARIAILDFDIHHGDGTQDIFYDSDQVLYISVHLNPEHSFQPTGFETERGRGKGIGLNVNLTVEHGTSKIKYHQVFDKAIKNLNQYNPDAIVISAGFDAHKNDFPPQGSSLTQLDEDDYAAIGQKIASLNTPICIALEGGYNLEHLSSSVVAFLQTLHDKLLKGKTIR